MITAGKECRAQSRTLLHSPISLHTVQSFSSGGGVLGYFQDDFTTFSFKAFSGIIRATNTCFQDCLGYPNLAVFHVKLLAYALHKP